VTTRPDDYWQKQARRYDRATLLLNQRFPEVAEAVAEALPADAEVLEVAAGTGLVTQVAVSRARRYLATDGSPAMLEILRGRLGEQAHLEVREADALALDLPDASFDAVLVCNLLHLLDEPTAALAEARRVLRPGGLLVAPTFCHGAGLVAQGVSRVIGLTGFPIVTRFVGEDLDELVTEAGFEVRDARTYAGLLPIRFVAATRP